GLRRQLAVFAIPVADAASKLHVGARAAGELDEAILVERRNSARGCLSSDPVRFFRKAYGMSKRRDAQRCADAAHSRARDKDVAGDLARLSRNVDADQSLVRIARQADLLDIHDRVTVG